MSTETRAMWPSALETRTGFFKGAFGGQNATSAAGDKKNPGAEVCSEAFKLTLRGLAKFEYNGGNFYDWWGGA